MSSSARENAGSLGIPSVIHPILEDREQVGLRVRNQTIARAIDVRLTAGQKITLFRPQTYGRPTQAENRSSAGCLPADR